MCERENRNAEYSLGDLLAIPVAPGVRIWAGTLVCTDSSGRAVPAEDKAGLCFEGVSTQEAIVPTEHEDEDEWRTAVVVRRRGRYRFGCCVRLTQRDMSLEVYVHDDRTVCDRRGSGHKVACGRIDRIEENGECWIFIDAYTGRGRFEE